MLVKNTGHKIINFGQAAVLPGETATISDTFKGDSTVKMFIALGYIEEVVGKGESKGNGGKAPKKSDKTATPEAPKSDEE